jgi:hypothetical protein
MYLIATIFARGWEFGRNQAWRITGGAGLITVLTLIAAIILAISSHYPQRTFDLVMGLNRWCYRVPCLRRADKRQISAVPARHRRHRPPGHLSPLPAGTAPYGSSGRAGNIDAGHEGARQDRSGCKCMAEECLISAATPRRHSEPWKPAYPCWRT